MKITIILIIVIIVIINTATTTKMINKIVCKCKEFKYRKEE